MLLIAEAKDEKINWVKYVNQSLKLILHREVIVCPLQLDAVYLSI